MVYIVYDSRKVIACRCGDNDFLSACIDMCLCFCPLFDSTQTMVSPIGDDLYQVQVVSWYDNENSYTSQMVRTIKYFAELA